MTQNVAAQKRTVATSAKKEGLSVQDLILVAVLIAAGAVLKLTVSSFLSFAGMKPNFMIAMYCLAIILTRPKVYQSVVIGLLVGLVSQLPMLNACEGGRRQQGFPGRRCSRDHHVPVHHRLRLHVRHDRGRRRCAS